MLGREGGRRGGAGRCSCLLSDEGLGDLWRKVTPALEERRLLPGGSLADSSARRFARRSLAILTNRRSRIVAIAVDAACRIR